MIVAPFAQRESKCTRRKVYGLPLGRAPSSVRPVKARVVVTLKRSVLDPQGAAVTRALGTLGFSEVQSARLGKIIELELDEKDAARARERVVEMCEKLLANTVIEEYRLDSIDGVAAPAKS